MPGRPSSSSDLRTTSTLDECDSACIGSPAQLAAPGFTREVITSWPLNRLPVSCDLVGRVMAAQLVFVYCKALADGHEPNIIWLHIIAPEFLVALLIHHAIELDNAELRKRRNMHWPMACGLMGRLMAAQLVVVYYQAFASGHEPDAIWLHIIATEFFVALLISHADDLVEAKYRERRHLSVIYTISPTVFGLVTIAIGTLWGLGTIHYDDRLLVLVLVTLFLAGNIGCEAVAKLNRMSHDHYHYLRETRWLRHMA